MEIKYDNAPLNGIIRYLVNTSQQDKIKIKASSNYSSERDSLKILEYDESSRHWASKNEKSYLMISFPFSFGLKQYSIRSSHASINQGNGYLLQWSLEGSTDGRRWTMIEDVGETHELANYNISTRKVPKSFNKIRFQHFRFKNKVNNLDNGIVMRISNIDFFGTVDPTPIRLTCKCQMQTSRFALFIMTLMNNC